MSTPPLQEPAEDGDGPPPSALAVGRLVHRGVHQAAPGRVGHRPGPGLHPPPQDEEQRFGCVVSHTRPLNRKLISSLICSDRLLSATEAPLTQLFNGDTEKDQNHCATEAKLRLEASKKQEGEGSVQETESNYLTLLILFFKNL